jgi:hypothetical protein
MATRFSGGGSRNTRREPPTMSKQLVNFITCGCESSALFLLFTKPSANLRRVGDRRVWVVRSNDLAHWATSILKDNNTLKTNTSDHFLQFSSFRHKICLASSNERMMNAIVFSSHRFAGFFLLLWDNENKLDIYCLFSFRLENNKPQICFRYKVVKVSLKGV